MRKIKMLKSTILTGVIASCVLPAFVTLSNCKKDEQSTKIEAKNIDGSDWEGLNAGSFISDDYIINDEDKTVTYISAVSIRSYHLVIPNYVNVDDKPYAVYIGERCFMNNGSIAGTVELNDFITNIPDLCFYNCTSLTGVIFHVYPLQIGQLAFANCFLLSMVIVLHNKKIYRDWSSKLTNVKEYAFFNAQLDGELIFGPLLTYVGQSAFENCTGITSVDFSLCTNLTSTSPSEFGSCGLLQSVYLSPSMTIIAEKTFRDCVNLTTVNLPVPDMDLIIESNAFYHCTLFQDFSTPPNILKIGTGAFAMDTNIQFCPWDPKYHLESLEAHTFSSCGFSMLKFWKDGPSINDFAFANNDKLSVLDFTDFVTEPDRTTGDPGGKVIIPDWQGTHIFAGANAKGGVVYLPTNGILNDDWIEFFAKNDIELSSTPSSTTPKWKVQYGLPRVDNVTESETKSASAKISNPTVTFKGFHVSTIGDPEYIDEDGHTNIRGFKAYYHPRTSPLEQYETENIIDFCYDDDPTKFDLIVTIKDTITQPLTLSGTLSFFFQNNKVPSLSSKYTIQVTN